MGTALDLVTTAVVLGLGLASFLWLRFVDRA